MLRRRFLSILAAAPAPARQTVRVGPANGSLLAVGGGTLGPAIVQRFLQLAGGVEARMVIIPTADTRDQFDDAWVRGHFLARAGARNLTVRHTRDRGQADSKAFTRAIEAASGVWFNGGRQWRLADAYLHTRTHRQLFRLLDRGGVIGGTSAGATIQGSYLVRGAREGNHIMMAPGYETGMAFLRGVAIDQHLLKRKRETDLVAVIDRHPNLLGIGIDEATAIAVRRDEFEVIGDSKVAIYAAGGAHYFLNPGERFDMAARRRL
jgi:cyanophycinase